MFLDLLHKLVLNILYHDLDALPLSDKVVVLGVSLLLFNHHEILK